MPRARATTWPLRNVLRIFYFPGSSAAFVGNGARPREIIVTARKQRKRSRSPAAAIVIAGLSAAACFQPLPAAEVNSSVATPGEIDEIIVTSRKREESEHDVPFSINAQTAEAMRSSGATSLEDVARNVAGFTVQNLGPGQSQVAIRGVSSGQIVRDQPGVKEQVGVYLDESVISLSLFTPDLDLYDLSRLEVLRGPQGTLFGAGSEAGTVRYITNRPNLTEAQSNVEVSGYWIDHGDIGGDAKAMVNVPLVPGKAALRAVVYENHIGGFIDAVQPNGGIAKNVNDGEKTGVRVAILFQPTDELSITPRVIYQNIDMNGFNRQDVYNILANPYTTTRSPVALGEDQQFTQLQEKFTDQFTLLDTTVNYDFGNALLTSISSFTDRKVLVLRDATSLTSSVSGGTIGLPQPVYTLNAPLYDRTTAKVFTQELRLASTGNSPFQWVGGVFFDETKRRYGQTLPVDGFQALSGIPTTGPGVNVSSGPDVLFLSNIPYDLKQYAVFAELNYALTSQLKATAGVRWYDYDEKRLLNFDGLFGSETLGHPGEAKANGFVPRFILAYDASNDVKVTGQASKGFRLGGINDPLNTPLCSAQDLATFGGHPSWTDETLWNYELGAKMRLMDGRASFNVSVFYADIKNLQATVNVPTCSSRVIFNVPKASSKGVEAELTMKPIDHLEFSLSGTYTDAKLNSTVTSTSAGGATTVVAGLQDGNRLPTAPKVQAATNATYTTSFRNAYSGFATATLQYVGSRFTQFSDEAPGAGSIALYNIGNPTISTFNYNPELPAYTIGNLRIGAKSDRYELALYVNNVTDKHALLSLDLERGGSARVGYEVNQPRTVGLTLRVNFEDHGSQ
jgi:iron complex outermembrane receptor protein